MNYKPLFPILIAVAALSGFVACHDDDNNNSATPGTEQTSTQEPENKPVEITYPDTEIGKAAKELVSKLKGTYVELFSQAGINGKDYENVWLEACKEYSNGDETTASLYVSMLKGSMSGSVIGDEAVKKYGDGSNGFGPDVQFCCEFTQGVAKVTFDGEGGISGVDSDGKELFKHRYQFVGYDETFDFYKFKSVDGNTDEFAYFFMRGDSPADTYHIEFRYGTDEASLLGFSTGKYAYWMAAGVIEDSKADREKSIRLFVTENLSEMVVTKFATADLSFGEFYEGDLGKSAKALTDLGLDGVSSATSKANPENGKVSRFAQYAVSDNKYEISGVKDVAIGMTEAVFNNLTDDQKARLKFVDAPFETYKQLMADGSFSAFVNSKTTEAEGVTATISSGASATWGNYVISLSGLSLPEGVSYIGAVITTEDGEKFGLEPLYNLWLKATEVAFCVKEFTEVHGNSVGYKHTAGLNGKKLKTFSYILQNGSVISVPLNGLLVKSQVEATLSADVKGLEVTVNDIPEGYNLVSLYVRDGKKKVEVDASNYQYSNGKFTFINKPEATTTYNAVFESDKNIDLGVAFEIVVE